MAESKSTGSSLPESPLVGSSYVGPAVSGTAFGKVGVSGSSVAPPTPSAPGAMVATPVGDIGNLISDGVFGEGKNGVHGVSAYDNGVLGENSATGYGAAPAPADLAFMASTVLEAEPHQNTGAAFVASLTMATAYMVPARPHPRYMGPAGQVIWRANSSAMSA